MDGVKAATDRNEEIWQARRSGETLQQIADRYGITASRVSKIVSRANERAGVGSPRKAAGRTKADGERVRLRIGNLAKAVLVTGQAYQDPKDALNEFVSNAADEYTEIGRRGERVRVMLRRKGKRPVIAIDDVGRGMDPDRCARSLAASSNRPRSATTARSARRPSASWRSSSSAAGARSSPAPRAATRRGPCASSGVRPTPRSCARSAALARWRAPPCTSPSSIPRCSGS